MTIYSVYVINKAGGLIYHLDNNVPKIEIEKTFSYPLKNLFLRVYDEKVVVSFGQQDGIRVGHAVLAINGIAAVGRTLEDGRDILELIQSEAAYPLAIRFGKPRLTTNEKIMLLSMFHSLFAISVQLSPQQQSSGIQVLETDTFRLHCYQTQTGVKFIVVTDTKQLGQDSFLKKLYELYSDFALKNPFYSLDMPIRCELFDTNLQQLLESAEKTVQST